MDVQVAQTGPCSRTVTIRIPPERIRDHIDRAFSAASRQVKLKGFRSGKVPRPLLEKRFGEAIRNEAREQLLNDSFRDACRDHDIRIVGQPRVEGIDPATPVDGSIAIEFKVHLDVQPTIALAEVEGIEIEVRSTAATDADVDKALEQLADQKKTLDAVDEPCGENDFVRADLEYRDEAGAVVYERKEAQLNPNIPIAGTDPAAFKSTIVGLGKDQDFTLDLEFSPHFEVEAQRGKKGKVAGRVLGVQRVQRAPIDDALAKEFGFDGLEKLRAELHKQIGERKEVAERLRQEESILTRIVETTPFELPPSLVERQIAVDLDGYRQRLSNQGRTKEEVENAVEQARDEAAEGARRKVRMVFLLDAIAKAKGIGVQESDMVNEINAIAQHHNVPAEEVVRQYRENNLFGDLSMAILERKVREYLRDKAKITDKAS